MKLLLICFLSVFAVLHGGEPQSPTESQQQNLNGVWKKIPAEEREQYLEWREKLSDDAKNWELKLEKNLGGFYFPQHVKSTVAGLNGQKAQDWGFGFVKDNPDLPRVLIIGDSISRSYTAPVRKKLQKNSNVHRIPANGGNSTNLRGKLAEYLGDGKWDVIVYNFGIHDANGKTPEKTYRENWTAITETLKRTGAKLIWVRTTPTWDKEQNAVNPAIITVNQWSDSLVAEQPDIHICDLYSLLVGAPGGAIAYLSPDNVHMNREGNKLITREVAGSVREVLRNRFGKGIPYLKDFALPKPAEFRMVKPEEMICNPERLKTIELPPVYGSAERLTEVANYLKNDPDGQKLWRSMVNRALRNLNAWNIVPLGTSRYSSRFSGIAMHMPFIYALTGHELLGKFIHDYTMHAMTLGDGFWYGDNSQRAEHASKKIGTLDNSFVGKTITTILTFSPDVFTSEEKQEIEHQLREDGMNACLKFIKNNRSIHNFLAVMSCGAFIPATYLKDEATRHAALDGIRRFVTNSIEKDGSYGEGFGYFGYPTGELFTAVLCMNEQERKDTFALSGLKHSPEWLAYPAYYNTDKKGNKLFYRSSFGDDNYFVRLAPHNSYLLAVLFDSPLAAWLGSYYASDPQRWSRLSWQELMLAGLKKLPVPQSPVELDLPLVRTFDNGESYIRDGWRENSTVFSLFAVHNVGSRGFHQRPESNSFNLAAFGIPLIMSSGNTNMYSSSIQREYLIRTRAANTISIDNTEQKKAQQQETSVRLTKVGKNADVIINDAINAYTQPLKQADRIVIKLRDTNIFIIIDKFESTGAEHLFDARIHLNNIDFTSKLESTGELSYLFSLRQVAMRIDFLSPAAIETRIEKSLIVSPKYPIRDILNQAKQIGNSLEISVNNRTKTNQFLLFTVLQPFQGEAKTKNVSLSAGTLNIGGTRINVLNHGVQVDDEKFIY